MTSKIPFLVGRTVLGGFFLYNGIHHFTARKAMASYVGSKKVPMPDAAVAVTGAALTLGGASILLGIKPKAGVAALVGFLAGVSPIMHNFWSHEDPQRRQFELVNFSKNMGLLGASLALRGVEEPWPKSVSSKHNGTRGRIRRAVSALAA